MQEQVRSGDASATELFELGAVMLRRKFYPAATKYLLQAIEKWDGDDQDLAQVRGSPQSPLHHLIIADSSVCALFSRSTTPLV